MNSSEKIFCFEQNDLLIKSMPILQELRKNGVFCDVILKTGNEDFQIPAHRPILAATIPYFYTMFTSDYKEGKQREVIIKDIDSSTLEVLVEFSYSGKIKVDPQNVQKLMKAADYVQLIQVKDACADYLKSTIQAGNIFEIAKLADSLNCQQLVSAADEYFNENFSEIAESEEFLLLELEELKELIVKEELTCTEEIVFEAAMKWVKHREAGRSSHLPKILSKIRFSLVSTKYLVNTVSTEKLIRSSFECLDIVDKAKSYHLMQCENKLTPKSRGLSKICSLVPVISDSKLKLYDLLKNEWINEELLNGKDKKYSAVVLFGNKIYVIGGDSNSNNNMDIYDLETKKWSKGKNMINGRSSARATLLNDYIYVFDGWQVSNNLSSFECYSIKENSWKAVAAMTKNQYAMGVTSLNGYIYAIGGHYEQTALNYCEKYDPASNTWTSIKPLLQKRYGMGVVAFNNKIYVCGGCDASYLNSCEVYDPSLDSWEFVTPMNKKRYRPSLAYFKGLLYVVGDSNNIENANSVEVYCPETNSWKLLDRS